MKKYAFLALAALLAVASHVQFNKSVNHDTLSIPSEINASFQSWLSSHDKSYGTPEEFIHRLKIFYQNYLYISDYNKKNVGGAILGLNKFADLHLDEFLPGYGEKIQESKVSNSI